jgi:hypothetical protein
LGKESYTEVLKAHGAEKSAALRHLLP